MQNTVRAHRKSNHRRASRQAHLQTPQAKPGLTTDELGLFIQVDSSINSASALVELLADKIVDYHSQLNIDDDIARGVVQLATDTTVRLKDDFKALFGAMHKQNEEVTA